MISFSANSASETDIVLIRTPRDALMTIVDSRLITLESDEGWSLAPARLVLTGHNQPLHFRISFDEFGAVDDKRFNAGLGEVFAKRLPLEVPCTHVGSHVDLIRKTGSSPETQRRLATFLPSVPSNL